MDWLQQFIGNNKHSTSISEDAIVIFVSNGNNEALKFYTKKGFKLSHQILGGFITVMRKNVA